MRASATGISPGRLGNHHERVAPHAIYPCAGEDQWIAIEVHTDQAWRRLVDVMEAPDWATDARFDTNTGRLADQHALDEHIAAWTREQDGIDLMDALQDAGVEAGVVEDFDDLLEDPQLAHREHFVEIEHPELGALLVERCGFRIDGAPGGYTSAGPRPGEHNRAVLGGILGLDDAEIERLIAVGVVR